MKPPFFPYGPPKAVPFPFSVSGAVVVTRSTKSGQMASFLSAFDLFVS
jgi:hypothetical protein